MTMPIVSIIIPLFNSERFIQECVDSILKQQYSNYEVIIVDDGSTDGSSVLCDKIKMTDDRIRVFHILNGGAANARKYGVSQAKGEWIMFVDSDDTITPNGLSLIMSLSGGGYDMIAGAVNKNGRLFSHSQDGVLSARLYLLALLEGQTTDGPVGRVIRKKLFERFDWNTNKEIKINEDMLMLIGLACHMSRVCLISDIVCYNYHHRLGTPSTGKMPMSRWGLLFEEIEKLINTHYTDDEEIRKAFCEYRLKRLYYGVVAKGQSINDQTYYAKRLIEECKDLSIDNQYAYYLRVLKSSRLRTWTRFTHRKYVKLFIVFIKKIKHYL